MTKGRGEPVVLYRGKKYREHAEFWNSTLSAIEGPFALLCDKAPNGDGDGSIASVQLELDEACWRKLDSVSKDRQFGVFVSGLSGLFVVLHVYAGAEAVIVEAPLFENGSGIAEPGEALVLAQRLIGRATLGELLADAQETVLQAHRFQEFPFNRFLVERAKVRTNVLLSCRGIHSSDPGSRSHDIEIELLPGHSSLTVRFNYRTGRFDRSFVQELARDYVSILGRYDNLNLTLEDVKALAAESPIQAGSSDVRPGSVSHEVAAGGSGIHDLFEEQVELTPDSIAAVSGEDQIGYGALSKRANQLGHYLKSLGVGPEAIVGLCVERDLEMVIGMLGILKSGGAYVALDSRNPRERLALMVEDAGIEVVVTLADLGECLDRSRCKCVYLDSDWALIARGSDAPPATEVKSVNAAYLVYTSGSTGRPKGVTITHSNVIRLFETTLHWFRFDADDVWTVFHSYAFDFSVWEMFGALLHGARAIVIPYWMSRSPEDFYELLCEQRVTILSQTPSAFSQMVRLHERQDGRRV
ncbi:MAG TPA: AMP-binding protein, partial [Blastocatellia bacterium]|nr:AMP-binding protein [Blastocatellia bacterium]